MPTSKPEKKEPKQPLSVTHPELAIEAYGWDPGTVVAGSHNRKSWKCSEGHVWETAIYARSNVLNSTGCPFCSNNRVWPGFNDLQTKFPEISKQAHGWDPSQIHSGARVRKEWACSKGHTWEAEIGQRTNSGNGCPVCSNFLIQKGINDLATTNPDIAKQAHGWDPTSVVAGSAFKGEWLCELGHIWSARVYSRTTPTQGRGCPVCAGKVIQVGFNDLATTHPAIAKQAHGWDPTTITKGSAAQKEWICSDNHVWKTSVNSRASRNRGCPICSGSKVLKGFNDLATTHPELAKELVDDDAESISKGSDARLTWRCSFGHTWKAAVGSRSRGSGCPYCSGLLVIKGESDLISTHPELAAEAFGWDPSAISKGNDKKRTWKCSKGHIFTSTANVRTYQLQGCPICSGHQVLAGFNDLLTISPEIAAEAFGWDPTKITKGHNGKKKWNCPRGHIYTMAPVDRTHKMQGCPICSGHQVLAGFNDIATTFPLIASQAVGWDPTKVSFGSGKKLRWRCEEGHEWITTPNDRIGGRKGCPSCAKYGFDPNKDGYLYFISHPDWEMLQIGITNVPDDRLKDHKKLGWEVLELRGPMDGHLTQQWETAILRMLKKKGADLSNEKIAGKFDGYSEAWTKATFPVVSIKELMRLTDEFEESKLGD